LGQPLLWIINPPKIGIGFLAYELLKNYKENIEAEPAYQEMRILRAELEKWTSAISCLGREPLDDREYGSLEEGGAINALYNKKILNGYTARIYDCSREIQKTLGSNAAWAAVSMTTLGLVKKPEKS
jgi:hypothetical protein